MGVIDNDFHNRADLTPNLCALYVEPTFRHQGLAGILLTTVGDFLANSGFKSFICLQTILLFMKDMTGNFDNGNH